MNIFNSRGIHVGVVRGASIFNLNGQRLYRLKGNNIYRLSGELIGIFPAAGVPKSDWIAPPTDYLTATSIANAHDRFVFPGPELEMRASA